MKTTHKRHRRDNNSHWSFTVNIVVVIVIPAVAVMYKMTTTMTMMREQRHNTAHVQSPAPWHVQGGGRSPTCPLACVPSTSPCSSSIAPGVVQRVEPCRDTSCRDEQVSGQDTNPNGAITAADNRRSYNQTSVEGAIFSQVGSPIQLEIIFVKIWASWPRVSATGHPRQQDRDLNLSTTDAWPCSDKLQWVLDADELLNFPF